MRKGILASLLAVFSIFSLASCTENKNYSEENYFLEMAYKPDFKILQLTDIHFSNKDDLDRHYAFMDLTINDANADLIVVSGDLFTFASKDTVRSLFSYFDSKNTPWTVTFGNHDEQGYFSVDWLTGYLNDLNNDPNSNCLFKDIIDDDVFGNANFVINLVDGSAVKEQIYILDSNRYNYSGYFGYDYVKDSEIAWYDRMVDYSTDNYGGGTPIPSIIFMHIPLPEWNTAWDELDDPSSTTKLVTYEGEAQGEKREKCCVPEINTGFFDHILAGQSTKGIFVGHDHVNDYTVLYKGIYLSYGLKSTDRIYYDSDMLGGSLIKFADGNISIKLITHTYEEVE